MFYTHTLKHLGVRYSFPELLNQQPLGDWCGDVQKPSSNLLRFVHSLDVQKNYQRANNSMKQYSTLVNELFFEEIQSFLKREKSSRTDTDYFYNFLHAHFSQKKHLRVLITELVGNMLLDAQMSATGLRDDVKVRKIINKKQFRKWAHTIDLLSLGIEVLNAASYSADDAFDRTSFRYGVPTVSKSHGHFAGIISADILLHYLGNYLFYKIIREHEKGAESGYLSGSGAISTNSNPYSLKWEHAPSNVYVYINPEQYMDVWEVWTWAWYMINSGQIRDIYEFTISNIESFDVHAYAGRAYRLAGGFMESAVHLSCAFSGCGYWKGRQSLGKWAAVYGTILQIRNDFYDYVTYTPPGHTSVKGTHEDIGLGRVTLPFGFAYSHARKDDKKKLFQLAQCFVQKVSLGERVSVQEKLQLNAFIAKNGGFLATKRVVYNLTLWALQELMAVQKDFSEDTHYHQLVAWTIASLNVINLTPEEAMLQEKRVKNILNIEEVYSFLSNQN